MPAANKGTKLVIAGLGPFLTSDNSLDANAPSASGGAIVDLGLPAQLAGPCIERQQKIRPASIAIYEDMIYFAAANRRRTDRRR
jgi:hypothetical protein